jgi:hypothetical protein
MDEHQASRIDRRELIKKGAVVGGNLLWIAPAIQTLAPKAMAASGSFTCCQCGRAGNQSRAFLNVASSSDCAALCASQETPGSWTMTQYFSGSTPMKVVFTAGQSRQHTACAPA